MLEQGWGPVRNDFEFCCRPDTGYKQAFCESILLRQSLLTAHVAEPGPEPGCSG